jgi:hypothetical protein
MDVQVFDTKQALGEAAAADAARLINAAIATHGRAVIVAATGASQFEFLDALTQTPGIDWPRVIGFHLDEYIGLPSTHPASFGRYLRERIVDRVHPGAFHYINGEAEPAAECRRVGALIGAAHHEDPELLRQDGGAHGERFGLLLVIGVAAHAIEYASGDLVRRTSQGGLISFRGRNYRVGRAFTGELVALRATADGVWDVYYCLQRIATLGLRLPPDL